MPANISHNLRLCLNDVLKEKRVSLQTIVIADRYLKCSFSCNSVKEAFELHSDFYLSEIQLHLSQESVLSAQLLEYFNVKLDANPLVSSANGPLIGLLDICVDLAFLDEDPDVYLFNFGHGRRLRSLKKYVLHRILSEARVSPEPLEYLGDQRQFSTESTEKSGKDYKSLINGLDWDDVGVLFDLKNGAFIPVLLKLTAYVIGYRQDLHAQFYRKNF